MSVHHLRWAFTRARARYWRGAAFLRFKPGELARVYAKVHASIPDEDLGAYAMFVLGWAKRSKAPPVLHILASPKLLDAFPEHLARRTQVAGVSEKAAKEGLAPRGKGYEEELESLITAANAVLLRTGDGPYALMVALDQGEFYHGGRLKSLVRKFLDGDERASRILHNLGFTG